MLSRAVLHDLNFLKDLIKYKNSSNDTYKLAIKTFSDNSGYLNDTLIGLAIFDFRVL